MQSGLCRRASSTFSANNWLRLRYMPQKNNRRKSNRFSVGRSFHWLFRSNIAPRRQSLISMDTQKRNFFGIGEIIGVISNPAETVRSLAESKKLLEEARQEIQESRERAQIKTKHTFTKLPGFFARPAEVTAIERAIEGDPSFTVLCGSSSVGKTALLREVLSDERYHVLHFDLRIAGFADLTSLYMSLSNQMEQYFEEISSMDGYKEFEKEGWTFKHDRLNVERRVSDIAEGSEMNRVRTSDVARLLELFQNALQKYSAFNPLNNKGNFKDSEKHEIHELAPKKIPVIFFDEAHRLPALIQSVSTMKCILDSMLVLTKQDRLCHVIHATSDPFYQTWLRQLNVMQHCKILTIGDCTKDETHVFFRERLLSRISPRCLQAGLNFEHLYVAFGGKLAHWYDYVSDYVHSNGHLHIRQSSHFLQAHALLNFHLLHSYQDISASEGQHTNADTKHASSSGFQVYSPMTTALNENTDLAIEAMSEFTAQQLLRVMNKLVETPNSYLSYFHLCRELGVRAVDGMVRGKILDLQWTEPVARDILSDRGTPKIYRSSVARDLHGAGSSGTAVDDEDYEGEGEGLMIAVSDRELFGDEFVGPKLLPITPIMRFAMNEVLQEYNDTQSVSEYASLSDVDEY